MLPGRKKAGSRRAEDEERDFVSETTSKAVQSPVVQSTQHAKVPYLGISFWASTRAMCALEFKSTENQNHFIDLNDNAFYRETESDYSLFCKIKETAYYPLKVCGHEVE